jgi:hypothetical protein
MNRLVIVGNGFDMSFGYRTKVYDFLLSLLKIEILNFNSKSEYESQFFRLKSTYRLDHNAIARLKVIGDLELLINNFIPEKIDYKSNLLKLIVKLGKDTNWYDIESTYYSCLTKRISSNNAIDNIGAEKLNAEMSAIVKALTDYLMEEENRMNPILSETHLDFFQKLGAAEMSESFFSESKDSIVFINFNYTSILKRALDSFSKFENYRIMHVHGVLGDESEPIIMGYGNDMDYDFIKLENNADPSVLEFLKPFHYSRDSKYLELISICEMHDYSVYIAGHSCGITDKTLLKTIVEHKNCKKIRLFHKGTYSDFFKRNVSISKYFEDKISRRNKIMPFDPSDVICSPSS